MACPKCQEARQQQLPSCPHCGVTLVAIPSLAQAKEHFRQRQLEQARALLEQAAKQFPQCAEAQLLLGACCLGVSQPDQAVLHLEEAVRLAIANASYRYNLAMAYQAAGRLAEAHQQLLYALQVDPQYEKATAALQALPQAPAAPAPMRTLGEEPAPRSTAAPAPAGMRALDADAGGMRGVDDSPRPAAQPAAAQAPGPAEPRAPAHLPRQPAEPARDPFAASAATVIGAAVGVSVLGAILIMVFFQMLTSAALISRADTFISFATKGALLVAALSGIAAASLRAPGLPQGGLIGGLAAGSLGLLIGAGAESARPAANVLAITTLSGGLLGVLGELVAKSGPLSERRGLVLWGAFLVTALVVVRLFLLQGVIHGRVYYAISDPLEPGGYRVPLPDAVVTVYSADGKTPLYRARSAKAEGATAGNIVNPGDNGRYTVHNVPVGEYKVVAELPETHERSPVMGAKAEYAMTGGSEQGADLFITHVVKVRRLPSRPLPVPEQFRRLMPPNTPGVSPAPENPGAAVPEPYRRVTVPDTGGSIKVPTQAPSSLGSGDE